MDKNTKIEWKDIDRLIPYENNFKIHTESQIANIAKSISENGWQNVIMVDQNDVIIYGHGRVLGGIRAGKKKAPCIVCSDMSPEQIKNYRALDNLLAEGQYGESKRHRWLGLW